MKLTGELKDKVDKTESMEEKKFIIAQAGMELTDNEFEMVTGGIREDELLEEMYNKVNDDPGNFYRGYKKLME